ncbi:aldo/keto reductase [Phreatobacter sp. AB_2022a]|uniref:aldo/keto reductase n=1 Tax=Phreatobacter sp. AB_2022a TaxID=3003134 RepID=UPI00228761AB|nr:aldo/keto reductase [Phreatobacter sp. AB_2022a]MCZ0738536.1 aldo/keto reductase [Phreatobacter sp. AB_2022a]
MLYRRLGRSGLSLSALSFGSWVTFGTRLDDRAARDCLALAYERGVNFFDSAEVYLGGEAERMLGRALKDLGWPRDSYCVSSKVLYGAGAASALRPTQRGLSAKHIVEACDQALTRFGLDYLDLYLCHRPEPDMSIPEICRTMHGLVTRGKILYWGTSEWPAAEIEALIAYADAHHLTPPQLEQPQYNLFHRKAVETDYAPLAARHGLGLTTWSPLASGVLAGRYDDGIPDGSRLTTEGFAWLKDFVFAGREEQMVAAARRLRPIAGDLGLSRAQLAIAWCLAEPAVTTVLLGASSREQLGHALDAVAAVDKLTEEVRRAMTHAIGPAA